MKKMIRVTVCLIMTAALTLAGCSGGSNKGKSAEGKPRPESLR
ncbi:hypothetical protein [[Clostridium] hylemonae]|nr:hypothetical protein [[Clostridium] hylemonae]